MNSVKLMYSWDTEYSADSVEWCPDEESRNIFVCGTYKLEQNTSTPNDNGTVELKLQQRIGRLYLFSCQNVEPYLLKEQVIEMPAILDCKWCPKRISGKNLLAVADAKGRVSIYELISDTENNSHPRLSLLAENKLPTQGEEDKLSLSLDWSIRLHCDSYEKVRLAVSDSKGCVSVYLLSDSILEVEQNWTAHEFEAWIVSFNHWNPSIVYTGGDDCKLCVYDIRCGTDNPLLTSKLHSAGVTSMNYSPHKEHLFASGSYDENLYIWDTRQMRRYIGSENVGGGIWRLKWEPDKGRHLLAACMYNGFRVLDCLDESRPNIIAEFNEHESIAYGSDWCHLPKDILCEKFGDFISVKLKDSDISAFDLNDSLDLKLIGTCSFYDHKLCISSFLRSNGG